MRIGMAADEKSYFPPLARTSAGFHTRSAVRFQRLEFVWMRLIDSQFQPI
jgi:hypothetical protein